METATADVRPKQVRYACQLFWGCLFLGFVLRILDAGSLNRAFVADLFSSGYLLVVALYVYLFVGVSKGRNSARILILAFFVLRFFVAPPSLGEFFDTPVTGVTEAVQIVAEMLALFLIFTNPGKRWFAARQVTSGSTEHVKRESVNSSLELLKAIDGKKQKEV